MGRFATDTGGGDFAQAPAGSHVARCIRLTDLGTHEGEYQGVKTVNNQVLVTWELPYELMDDGQPFVVSKFYTNSLGEKANLRKNLVSWRGCEFSPDELKRFDLQSILGKPCLLSIVHTDKGKAKVDGVMKVTKGTECPPQINKSEAFWLDEFSQTAFDKIPKGIQKIIIESPEYKQAIGEKMPESIGMDGSFDDDSDIPF